MVRAGLAIGTGVVAALGVVVLVIGVTQPPPLLSVAQLMREHARWDGRKVKVSGLLSYPWKDEEGEGFYLSSAPMPTKVPLERPVPDYLGFAYDKSFYTEAAKYKDRHVVITARFNATCFGERVICLDGSSDLIPIPGEPILLVMTPGRRS